MPARYWMVCEVSNGLIMSISQANMASHVPGTSLSPSPTGVERNVVGLQQRRPTIKKMLKVLKILVVFIIFDMVQKNI